MTADTLDKDDPLARYKSLMRIGAFVSYPVGMMLRKNVWRLDALTSIVFRKRLRQLETLIKALPGGHDSKTALRRHLECNLAMSWRLQAISECSDDQFERWVHIEGLEHIAAAQSAGRGVVLANSHYGSGKTMLIILARLGYEIYSLDRRDIFSMLGVPEAKKIHSIGLGDKNNTFFLKQVFQARTALKDCGLLHIAADGFKGQSGLECGFLGRKRLFPGSFAELAVQSDAVILPTFAPIDSDGRINFHILPALKDAADADHESRVNCLIEQYVSLLIERWSQDPGGVHENDLGIYCDLPFAEAV